MPDDELHVLFQWLLGKGPKLRLDLAHVPLDVMIDDGAEKRVLVREVLIERADADPSQLRDSVGRGALVTRAAENASGGLDGRADKGLGAFLFRVFSRGNGAFLRH